MTDHSPWSQEQFRPLGIMAKVFYNSDPRRYYHNVDHIERMIWHAENTFDYDYDPTLDAAIWGHDLIYDNYKDKELRSKQALIGIINALNPNHENYHGIDIAMAGDMIMDTATHINTRDDERIICLDLADLSLPNKVTENYQYIKQEAMELNNITERQFAEGSLKFMLELKMRVTFNSAKSTIPDFWKDVIRGIDQTIEMSRKIVESPL